MSEFLQFNSTCPSHLSSGVQSLNWLRKSWSLGRTLQLHSSLVWTPSYHLISVRLFLVPSRSYFRFSVLTPPWCHNDSKLQSRANCRYVPSIGLTGTDGGFIAFKWLMARPNAVEKNLPIFFPPQLSTLEEADKNQEVQEWSPEGFLTATCNSAVSRSLEAWH